MVGSGAPGARRAGARGRAHPGQRAVAVARGGRRRSARPTPTGRRGRGRGRARGHGPRRRAPGRRPGPAGPGLDVAAAGRPHRLRSCCAPTSPPPAAAGCPLLTGVALAEAVGEVTGVRAVAEVAQRPARRATAASWPGSSPRARGTAVVVGVGLNVDHDRRRSCPTPGRRWPGCSARPVDRGAGAAGLPARGRAALPPLDGGPRRPGGLRPGRRTTSPGRSTVGTDGRRRPCPTARPSRGSARGGRLGRPAVVATPQGRSSSPRGTCGTCGGS